MVDAGLGRNWGIPPTSSRKCWGFSGRPLANARYGGKRTLECGNIAGLGSDLRRDAELRPTAFVTGSAAWLFPMADLGLRRLGFPHRVSGRLAL